MLNSEEIIEAQQRAKEYHEMADEHCPTGGLLLGDESPSEEKTVPEPNTFECPDHLSDRARAEWNRISIEQKATLTPADAPALAAYCAAYGRWVEAEEKIQEFGVIVQNKAKNPMQNPYVAVAQQSLSTMRDFLTLLQHKAAKNTVF
jgi:P27 family predicted phage terminase small subunit